MNTSDFIDRIDQILKFHDLSASAFADTIGVQRSSISHLLAGRNKPSLEFVLKVVSSFPDADLYWLLYGKGIYPKKVKASPSAAAVLQTAVQEEVPKKSSSIAKDIDRIVIFYSDGSFKSYSEKGS